MAFLQTTPHDGNGTWFETLQNLPLHSKFSLSRLRFGVDGSYFDVRIHVPYEGEVMVCIQKTPEIVSTLEIMNGHLQNTNRIAKRYINQELEMLRIDPGLVTLQWTEDQSQSDTSVHEYKSDGSGATREQSDLPLPSNSRHETEGPDEFRDHTYRPASRRNVKRSQKIQNANPEAPACLPNYGLESVSSTPRFYPSLGRGAGGGSYFS